MASLQLADEALETEHAGRGYAYRFLQHTCGAQCKFNPADTLSYAHDSTLQHLRQHYAKLISERAGEQEREVHRLCRI